MIRALTLDPSLVLGSDFFGAVLGDIDVNNRMLWVKGAKRWNKDELTRCEDEIRLIVKEQGVNIVPIEINGIGSLVAKDLADLPLHKIQTVGHPPLEETKRTRKQMVKEEVIAYLVTLREQDRIRFPKILDTEEYADLRRLKEEWMKLQAIPPRTGRGTTIYSAPTGDNDDLIHALMLFAHLAQEYLENAGDIIIASTKPRYGHREEEWGSAIPDKFWMTSRGKEVYYP